MGWGRRIETSPRILSSGRIGFINQLNTALYIYIYILKDTTLLSKTYLRGLAPVKIQKSIVVLLYSDPLPSCLHIQSGIGNVYRELPGFFSSIPLASLWRSISFICRLKCSHLQEVRKIISDKEHGKICQINEIPGSAIIRSLFESLFCNYTQ